MNETYEWLYDNYGRDLQKELSQAEDAEIRRLRETRPLTREAERSLADCLGLLRLHWGTKSFALGVRLGLRLTADFAEK